MTFKDYKYERLSIEEIENNSLKLITKLKNASTPDTFMDCFKEINKYRGHIQTMMTLCSIRHTINTADKFYEAEQDYWDNTAPLIQKYEVEFFKVCLDCGFRDELPIPSIFFKLAENSLKCFDPCIIEELQEENRLASEYGKLKASAKIEFNGEMHNLASIVPYMMSNDREVRRKAFEAGTNFYAENEDKFDDIYDGLVKVRDKMAKKLGYKNFTELGYIRMNRFDYNEEMVTKYREEVLKYVTPIVSKIHEKQKRRIGVDKLEAYDYNYEFKTGNPTPKGKEKELVDAASRMYKEMSKETDDFFTMMRENELFDLTTKPNKQMGGYTTDLIEYKVPFIFSNFNGTSGDVDVLTHEAGHAFQGYLTSLENDIPDLAFPTMESCEIHSMSMEFFAHPWMELFFKEDKDKYYYSHIASTLTFLPYGVLVDHFQHEVYNHPEMSKDERKACFRRLEKMYKPGLEYTGYPILEKGGYFYRQGHIFESPFYYIDYTLAQVCALQFYKRMLDKDENCWKDYVHLCKLGGTKSFLELVKEASLTSPFEKDCLKSVVEAMDKELDKIDDFNM